MLVVHGHGERAQALLELLIDEREALFVDPLQLGEQRLGSTIVAVVICGSRMPESIAARVAAGCPASSARPSEVANAGSRVPTGTDTDMIRFAVTCAT